MKIIYISSVCSQNRFDELVARGLIDSQFQNQKFHNSILKGLSELNKYIINVISFYPIKRTNKCIFINKSETSEKICYYYPFYINIPILHHITKFISTYIAISNMFNKNSIIVCNMMNVDECLAALFFRIFHNIKICCVTADVPGITSGARKKNGPIWKNILNKFLLKIYKLFINRYDAYVFLTEEMNNVVNTMNKPFIVIEGLTDISMSNVINKLENKYNKRTIFYAGGIHKEYGIKLLVEAFKQINNPDIELRVYGKGNYEDQLIKEEKIDSRIKFLGTKKNSEIIHEEIKSHILVNPRPTNEDFVKYSFPSKILEYMSTGTPLLTTRIPSIPKDYYPYVFFFEDYTILSFKEKLSQLIQLPIKELHNKGLEAKNFVLKNKNYKVQTQKIVKLLDKFYN